MIRNYMSLIFSQVANRLISFIWVIYLARHLGVTDYGRYGTIMAAVAILTGFIDFGVSFIIIRDMAVEPNKAPELFGAQIIQRASAGTLCAVALIAGGWILGYHGLAFGLLALAAVHMVAHNLGMIGDTIFSVYKKQSLTAIMNTLHASGWALLGYAALRWGYGLKGLFVVMCVNSIVISFVYAFIVFKRFLKPRFDFSFSFVWTLLRWSAPIGVTGLFGIVFDRADRIILAFFQGPTQVGFYNAAVTLISPFAELIWSCSIIILYPYMPNLYKRSEDFIFLFRRVLLWLVGLMMVVVLASIFLSHPIIGFAYGGKYGLSASLLSLIACYLLFIPFHGLMGRILIIKHQQKEYCYANFWAMVLNIFLNLALIPWLGAKGCCVAAIFTHLSLLFLYPYFGRQSFTQYIDWKGIVKLAAICLSCVLIVTYGISMPIVARLILLMLVYLPLAAWVIHFNQQFKETQAILTASHG